MSKKKLLVLDRDVYYAGIFAQRFESAGWETSVAETTEDAKVKMAKSIPDVIIVDLDPVDEMLDYLKELRKNKETSKVLQIALTAFGDRKTMNLALDAGVDHYLLKGHFVPTEAVKKVKRLLEEKNAV